MRERGLKQAAARYCKEGTPVAPHAGAWIETGNGCCIGRPSFVAPHAGAWIETNSVMRSYIKSCQSLPMRERGLKHFCISFHRKFLLSLPMRERGLKHDYVSF